MRSYYMNVFPTLSRRADYHSGGAAYGKDVLTTPDVGISRTWLVGFRTNEERVVADGLG